MECFNCGEYNKRMYCRDCADDRMLRVASTRDIVEELKRRVGDDMFCFVPPHQRYEVVVVLDEIDDGIVYAKDRPMHLGFETGPVVILVVDD